MKCRAAFEFEQWSSRYLFLGQEAPTCSFCFGIQAYLISLANPGNQAICQLR